MRRGIVGGTSRQNITGEWEETRGQADKGYTRVEEYKVKQT